MRIKFEFPGHSFNLAASVEDSLENCARLLVRLGAAVENGGEPVQSPDLGLDRASISENSDVDEWVPRTNRRKRVLETIQDLRSAGVETPSLGQIKHRFAQLFPEEGLDNLDQVVRDIANKTSKLERLERGTFKLTD